jgi:hypothetical protein
MITGDRMIPAMEATMTSTTRRMGLFNHAWLRLTDRTVGCRR